MSFWQEVIDQEEEQAEERLYRALPDEITDNEGNVWEVGSGAYVDDPGESARLFVVLTSGTLVARKYPTSVAHAANFVRKFARDAEYRAQHVKEAE